MTRINTNVSSLTAQKTLARSQAQLQEALTRLSTGLRINSGKDDPAGLIASEALRSDITSIQKAITNSQRANQMIATADSALGQVSSLLNDIRGLVSEAANKGAMSAEQIQANQLQIDSSLEAIDRIAQVTQFQGRRLLDGSLDFVTQGLDPNLVKDLQIDQANFGANNEIGVNVTVVRQASRGQLKYGFGAVANNVVLEIGGKQGFEAFSFAAGSKVEDMARAINLVADATGVVAEVQQEATQGALTTSSFGLDNDVVITANQAGQAAGDIRVKYVKSASSATTATYTAATGTQPALLEVQLGTRQWAAASGEVNPAGTNNAISLSANIEGEEFNGVKLTVTNSGGAITLGYDHTTKVLNIGINDGVTTANDLVNAINNDAAISALFTAAHVGESDGSGTLTAADPGWADFTTSGGVTGGEVIATANDVVAAINASPAAAVVTASLAAGNNGYGTVGEFQEYAYYGTAEAN
ncbi:MAG: flagellin, partial [Thermogutta sp.]|nr:flagellin [Thermogutta sp.]